MAPNASIKAIAGALTLTVLAAPAQAETPAQLDAESRASENASTGIALARKQMDRDELLDAMATLERVLWSNPESDEARALHASLLCRIDDRRGAMVEFDAMRGMPIPAGLNEEARAPCRQGG